ncbi:ABC transporter substrate-binding protein [Lactobacillus selangorensis]|uniref:ABC transporter substrate-binding protein n=1 Tax=Lactobacillus selangorensis TaxID=81857 RepID=UPI00138EDBB0|nr:ABC transporter substrate-binding protein [Lactobacillus selangorensis]
MKKHLVFSSLVALTAGALLLVGGGQHPRAVHAADTGSKTTVTFWHAMSGPYQKEMNEMVTDFNHSQNKYVVQATPQGNYSALQKKVMAAGKSKSLPTMGQTTYTAVPDYQKQGLITSLDTYVDSKNGLSKKDKKDIFPAFLASSQYKGHYYSMPFSKSDRIMYVNKDIVKKYGLKTPKTWADFDQISKKLSGTGIKSLAFDKSFISEYEGLAYDAGTRLVTKSDQPQLSSKKSVGAAKTIMNMIDAKTAETSGADFYYTQKFINGKAAYYISSSAGITQMKKQAPKTLSWNTMAIPSYKGAAHTATAGNDLVIFKGASKAQQKGAWAFMKYLTDSKQTEKWAMATGYLPLRKSVLQKASYKTYLKQNPTSQAAVKSLNGTFSSTAFPGFSEFYMNLGTAIDNMLTKHESPKKALDELQTKTETILKDNR